MRDEVAVVAPAAAATSRTGRPSLDLRAGLIQQLHALGVGRVHVDPTCTLESPLHFSHRRDQRTGRQAGLCVIESTVIESTVIDGTASTAQSSRPERHGRVRQLNGHELT